MITYKQIEQIEKYIKDVHNLKNNTSLAIDELFDAAKNLDKKIVASNLGYTSKINSYSAVNSTTENCLDMMEAALEGILNAIPYYQEIVEIREDISRGKETEEKQAFVNEMLVAYNGKIDFGKEVSKFADDDFYIFEEQKYDSIYNGFLRRMKKYLNEICEESQRLSEKVDEKNTIFVSQTQNMNVNVTTSDSLKYLDSCNSFTPKELDEIKIQISEIQKLLEDKFKNKKTIKEKIGGFLKWLGDKSVDAMIALSPLLIQMLQGM